MRIKAGDRGPAVGLLHQALSEAGETIGADELGTGTFGPSTAAAVMHFQAKHAGPDGHALVKDGIVGPATEWALEHPGGPAHSTPAGWTADTSLPVVAAAVADIGRCEDPDGSNDGPALAKFHTGGQPWCALAVSTWLEEAGGSPFGRKAAVMGIYLWARSNNRVVDDPRAGDLAVILRAGGHGHVGLVVGVLPDGTLATIEGNCSNAVRAMLRPRSALQAVVRP
jgi:hypothetical protein